MECGFTNACKSCNANIKIHINDRWFFYMPDGELNNKNMNNEADMHIDHIIPVSLCGSNLNINIQLLNKNENCKKSNSLIELKYIKKEMLSERFQHIIDESRTLLEFKFKLNSEMHKDILLRYKMSDEDLYSLYSDYCVKYNLKKNIKLAIQKFKKLCINKNIS